MIDTIQFVNGSAARSGTSASAARENYDEVESLVVSLVVGCVVERDAISNICRQQMDAIANWARARGIPLQIRLYALHTDVSDSRIFRVPNVLSLVADDHFQRSDVVLFHFGIYYELFDAIQLAPRTARTAVYYHGITPPFLFPDDEKQRTIQHQSYRQAVNLRAADLVFATSSFLIDDLRANLGIPYERMIRVPPCASFAPDDRALAPDADADMALRLIYVGRFMRQKGLHDLLEAVRQHRAANGRALFLNLVGSRRWADETYLQELNTFIERHGLGESTNIEFDVPSASLRERLGMADALVIPSYHEGFCVPVIEALGSGRFVIASNAGALPETTGGLCRTFPAGDVPALVSRLQELSECYPARVPTDLGKLARQEWLDRARGYAAHFTRERHDQRFCSALFHELSVPVNDTRKCAAADRRKLILGLAVQPCAKPVSLKSEAFLRAVSLPYVTLGQLISQEGTSMRILGLFPRIFRRVGREIVAFGRRLKRNRYGDKVWRGLKKVRSRVSWLLHVPANCHWLRSEISHLTWSSHSVHDILDSLSDVVLAQSRRLESQEASLAAQQQLLEALAAEIEKMASRRADHGDREPVPSIHSLGTTVRSNVKSHAS